MRLVERGLSLENLAPYFREGLGKINRIDVDDFQRIIADIPDGWMSDLAIEFTLCLLTETHRQLKILVQ